MEEMLNKTKKLLKSYQMVKFAVMVRTQDVENELFESDMKTLEELIDSVLGEDLNMNGKHLEDKLIEVRNTATLLHRMERCLEWLRKYPNKGEIYYEMIYHFYFSGFNTGHKVIAEMFDISRTTYYRYFKEAEKTYSMLLWNSDIVMLNET
ncbi:MAG: hypothetical protein KH828_06415 [Clostridiales bacterium]|nr:hypothetical protein [Clostridiales bacterium]